MPAPTGRYHPQPEIFMNPANTPANDPCKVNPYHRTDNQCLRNSQCPFKDKPVEMRAAHFRPDELVSIQDQYCSLCRSSLVPCPEVPPPPPPPPGPKWIRWAILGGLLLLVLAGLAWRFWPDKKPVPVCGDGKPQGDTCVVSTNTNYVKLCDGKGGFRLGDSIGQCQSTSPTFCQEGKVVGTICQNGDLYEKICDGVGGYKTGKLKQRNSVDCGGSGKVDRIDPKCKGDRMVKQSNGNYHLYKCRDGQPVGFDVIQPDDERYPD